ncbi:helix-turn-helix domain-containing protein [Enterococcus hermanniensis]|uniref:Mga helix-turn-helix domain-containing protein n=1 Tax=Enterococcus hermanniensis TaxID=249189 RepID=A0A1L8TMT3_9ENTE|nr:helix-turn-helix domain-containing protein [Enterococcus hermanniensis]OJG45629.1 hypothetical protein RV04_GL001918 [Enterococcus hermanniensis]
MFGLDNRTLLSKDIIEILDQVDYGLSVEDIQNKLGYSNPVTILSVCKEITAVIKKNYIHNHYQLEIDNSKRGLFELKRYSTNLQSLYKEIFSKDIAYDILMVLIQKRSISSEKICQTYNISRSTLQRKIKAINKEIADFQVYITCSERIQFKSDELLIRSFSYFFFWSMHRELDNTFWFPEGEQHLFNAKRILDYLGCAFDPIKSRSLALWIQFFSIGIAKKKTLNFSAEKLQFLESCQIPECPDFLTAWSNLEWRTLVGVIYVSNVYEYELVFQIEAVEPFLSAGDLCYEDFERAAEKQFSSISSYEKTKIQREIARYQLLNLFINPQAKKVYVRLQIMY